MSESLLFSTSVLLYKRVFFLLGAFAVICYFTISAKGFYDFVPNKRTLSPKKISQENFRQARCFLGSLELHRTVFPTWKSLPVNIAHPRATSVSFYGILFSDSIGSDGKESACNAGHPGSIPGSGRCPGEGNGKPSSSLAWRIPWTKEPGRLRSMG